MLLKKIVSKTKTHEIKYKNKEGKEVKKEVPNSVIILVLDSGFEIPISCLKKEDNRVLDSQCRVEYK